MAVGGEKKSVPFSMRLSERVDALISAEARRTGRSKGAVVEMLADEALRMRMFPGIGFRGTDWERRAWLLGTAHDVWQVVDAHRSLGSTEAVVAAGTITERQVRLALVYYEHFGSEIDEAIDANDRDIDELRELFPSVDISTPVD